MISEFGSWTEERRCPRQVRQSHLDLFVSLSFFEIYGGRPFDLLNNRTRLETCLANKISWGATFSGHCIRFWKYFKTFAWLDHDWRFVLRTSQRGWKTPTTRFRCLGWQSESFETQRTVFSTNRSSKKQTRGPKTPVLVENHSAQRRWCRTWTLGILYVRHKARLLGWTVRACFDPLVIFVCFPSGFCPPTSCRYCGCNHAHPSHPSLLLGWYKCWEPFQWHSKQAQHKITWSGYVCDVCDLCDTDWPRQPTEILQDHMQFVWFTFGRVTGTWQSDSMSFD